MSGRAIERALVRLTQESALLAPEREGAAYGVFLKGDRRRRPVARLSADAVRALDADGVLAPAEDGGFVLSAAGQARMRRASAPQGEGYAAQHGAIVERYVMERGEAARAVRGYDAGGALRRLASMRDINGRPWLSAAEFAAARQLREDWTRAQAGLVKGSDWRAPPNAEGARALNGQEAAMAARCDAERNFRRRLEALAPPLRRVVERVCLYEDGVEALERAEGWPARSGKVALKLGLSQLAAR